MFFHHVQVLLMALAVSFKIHSAYCALVLSFLSSLDETKLNGNVHKRVSKDMGIQINLTEESPLIPMQAEARRSSTAFVEGDELSLRLSL